MCVLALSLCDKIADGRSVGCFVPVISVAIKRKWMGLVANVIAGKTHLYAQLIVEMFYVKQQRFV